MEQDRDPLDDLGTAACEVCGHLMETAGTARDITIRDRTVVPGSGCWRCPTCGHASLI